MTGESSNDIETTDWSITTKRLIIRPALSNDRDSQFLFELWTNPEVMKYVGFPKGDLTTNQEKIKTYLSKANNTEFDRVLLACLPDRVIVGECKLCPPDKDEIAHTDLKLHPAHWGNHYGREIKQALVDYLFSHTACKAVRGTPNQNNIASIKMQEAVGGQRTGEGVFQFPESMGDYTTEVPYFEYVVARQTWMESQTKR